MEQQLNKWDEEFKHMVEMTEALKDIAAAAKQSNLWLVFSLRTVVYKIPLSKVTMITDDIEGQMTWVFTGDDESNGLAVKMGSIKLMSTAEVMGL